MSATVKPQIPALALNVEDAAASLSMSWDTFKAHVMPDLRIAYVGRRKVIPVSELTRWLDEHAEAVR